jgi:endoglucanase
MNKLLLTSLAALASIGCSAQNPIRLNQVGYQPEQEKVITIDKINPQGKIVVKNGVGSIVAKPKVMRIATSPWTGEKRYLIDLSNIKKPGDYTIEMGKHKATLHVAKDAYHDIAKGSLKLFYLIRSGIDIDKKYAGIYARKDGHPDTKVYIHASAATANRPEGTELSSPYGWYDAGDYNKYAVNSSYAIGVMQDVYEQIPEYFAQLNTNIPESDNTTPDFLDEMMFNLKWLITCQDPDDGGIYHKLTTPHFEAFIMPDECKQKRYLVEKSVTASLDFAAVMAQASRLFEGNKDYPEFSQQAREAAIKAYDWAIKNPNAFYRQNEMNKKFKPEVTTGEYGDWSARDEKFWAASELYRLTKDARYLEDAKSTFPTRFTNSSWNSVAELGLFTWIASTNKEMGERAKDMLKTYADNLTAHVATSNFNAPYGDKAEDFGWGCLGGNCCWPAIALMYADKYIAPGKYRKFALENFNYILGQNTTGYCYVTGYGTKSPMHPHHRISANDNIEQPFPGMLVGGPNPGQQDLAEGIIYPSKNPDASYADQTESYASNEIAINWNASLVGIACWLDATSK